MLKRVLLEGNITASDGSINNSFMSSTVDDKAMHKLSGAQKQSRAVRCKSICTSAPSPVVRMAAALPLVPLPKAGRLDAAVQEEWRKRRPIAHKGKGRDVLRVMHE